MAASFRHLRSVRWLTRSPARAALDAGVNDPSVRPVPRAPLAKTDDPDGMLKLAAVLRGQSAPLTPEEYKREMRYLFPTTIVDNSQSVGAARRVPYDDLPVGDPARSTDLRPTHSGYFTARAEYFQQVLELERTLEHLESLPASETPADAPARALSQVTWLKKDEMSVKLGVPLAINEYRGIVALLQNLWAHANGHMVHTELAVFLRPASQKVVAARVYKLDKQGRSYATGRRKAAVARVWVWPNQASAPASIKVNRQDLQGFFARPHDRLAVLEPLRLLDLHASHSALCTVRGGGATGQAGALRLGVARALERLNPAWRPPLRAAGLLTRDARVVESKKPGQKKARKKFTWVKR